MVAAGGRNGAGEREKARPLWNACKYDYTVIAPKVKWDFANVFRRLPQGFRRLYHLYTTDWIRTPQQGLHCLLALRVVQVLAGLV